MILQWSLETQRAFDQTNKDMCNAVAQKITIDEKVFFCRRIQLPLDYQDSGRKNNKRTEERYGAYIKISENLQSRIRVYGLPEMGKN